MENENQDIIGSQNDTDTTANEIEDVDFVLDEDNETIIDDEDVETLKKKVATLEAQKAHWKEKANKAKPSVKVEESKGESVSLSPRDYIALTQANVHADDVSEIEDYAKYKGISIAEALNSTVVKTMLDKNNEQRRIASATNTGKARPSQATPSDDTLLNNARSGKFDTDPAALVEARFNQKKQRK